MPRIKTEQYVEKHLYSDRDLMVRDHVPPTIIDRIMRIRDVHNQWINTPSKSEKELVNYLCKTYNLKESICYEDLRIVKVVIGNMTRTTKDFLRWKASNMAQRAFQIAENRKDARGMAAALAVFTKINQLDKPDDVSIDWDRIYPQHFDPTEDPTVIGITRTPNIDKKIAYWKKKLLNSDIQDVTYDEVDYTHNLNINERK